MGSVCEPKSIKKSMQIIYVFLITTLRELCSVSDIILEPFGPQNGARKRKRENVKIELSCRRELNFRGFGPSQTPKKSIKRPLSNPYAFFSHFLSDYCPILGAVWALESIKKRIRNQTSKIQKPGPISSAFSAAPARAAPPRAPAPNRHTLQVPSRHRRSPA